MVAVGQGLGNLGSSFDSGVTVALTRKVGLAVGLGAKIVSVGNCGVGLLTWLWQPARKMNTRKKIFSLWIRVDIDPHFIESLEGCE